MSEIDKGIFPHFGGAGCEVGKVYRAAVNEPGVSPRRRPARPVSVHGHAAGDKLLKTVVGSAKARLPTIDFFVRMGGDEFCIFLPKCNENHAKDAMARLRVKLMEAVEENEWPMSFSIGVITMGATACSAEDIIRKAEELMYRVRGKGKDDIVFQVLLAS